MAIQIGAKLDSGFDDPIGMLKDCHRRIERFLNILCLVVKKAKGRSLSVEERDAIHASIQYFQAGGQRHTADEEESLFPRLRSKSPKALEEVDRLEHDHREAEALHVSIERLYFQWINSGNLASEQFQQLLSETTRLELLYRDHIRIEETVVFAQASRMLDRHAIADIGAEFQSRRR